MNDRVAPSTNLPASDAEFARALLASQETAIAAVEAAMPSIHAGAEALASALRAGGRIVYAGAGSSGLIAAQDGAELAGTFGLEPEQIVLVMAGGVAEAFAIDAAAEDDEAAAARDMEAAGVGAADVVIAVSASGATPYTLACGRTARARGARLIGLANRHDAPLLALADAPIFLDSGAEALHGSTRLAAGTAQKAALGLLSTLANARLGHVWRGHMVNMRPQNAKLRRRAAHIVAALTGVSEERAGACLAQAGDDLKSAILIASGAPSRGAALESLARTGGQLGLALSILKECA